MDRNSKFQSSFSFIRGKQIVKGFLLIVVLMLFVFSLSGLLTSIKTEYRPFSESLNGAASILTGKMLFGILALENRAFASSIKEEEELEPLSAQLLKLSVDISLDDPRSFLGTELPGFSLFDSEILVAGEGTDYTNMPYESGPPSGIIDEKEADLQNADGLTEETDDKAGQEAPVTTGGKKVAFIYSSHNRESFLPYLKGVTNPDLAQHSQLNITKVGERLQRSLEDKGIGSVQDKTDIQANLLKKGLKFGKSYSESRTVLQQAMAGNGDLAYFIDIHRDARRKKLTTMTIDGKSYAKLAFVVGGENADYQKNYALAERLHKGLEKKYPGLSRGVFKQGGAGYNGVYNQDLSERVILIEAGGVDNTFEELYRSMDAFADVFSDYYWQDSNSMKVDSSKPAKSDSQ